MTNLSQEECFNLIKCNKTEWNNLRKNNPEWVPNFNNFDFLEVNLFEVDLRRCSLKNSNLHRVIDLQENMLAGSNLSGANLPESFGFSRLDAIEKLTEIIFVQYATLIFLCIFCLLTAVSTSDLDILKNASSSVVPTLNLPLASLDFFKFSPIILIIYYIYFHFNLNKLWSENLQIPEVFPDGKSIHQKSYFSVINDYIIECIHCFKKQCGALEFFEKSFIGFSIWWLTPIVLFIIWIEYLVNHDCIFSFLHSITFAVSIILNFFFIRKNFEAINIYSASTCNFMNILKDKFNFIVIPLVIFLIFSALNAKCLCLCNFKLTESTEISKKPEIWNKEIDDELATLDFLEDKTLNKLHRKIKNYIPVLGLEKRNLNGIKAKRAFLVNSDLKKASLSDAILQDAKLINADLTQARLQKANLIGAELQYAKLTRANLEKALLFQAKLQHANLDYAILKSTKFIDANLQNTALRVADLTNTIFFRADLRGALLDRAHSSRRALFANADLRGASLQYVNLHYADFRNAKLNKASFKHADLLYADLSGADLSNTDITFEQLKSAIIDKNTILPKNLKIKTLELLKQSKINIKKYNELK